MRVKQLLFWVGGAVAVVGFGWAGLVLLTPSYGTVVGYANTQPVLQVIQPPPRSPSVIVNRVLNAAEAHFRQRPDFVELYWPRASLIAERPDCWLVEFTRKEPIYQFLGYRHVYRPTDKAMYFSITKADNTLRYGRWCE